MEQVSRILVTKKEEKKLRELNHLLSLSGIDFITLSLKVEGLIEELKIIRQENDKLKAELEESKKAFDNLIGESKKYIQTQLETIATNVRNETQKSVSLMGDKIFKGNKINENI